MSLSPVVHAPTEVAVLLPSPINPAWLIEGTPQARCASLSRSADGSTWTDLWDCTAGAFYWYYDINETIHIIDGHAVVTDCNGVAWNLSAGDVMHFRYATRARWNVPQYVRKIAFCSEAVPQPLLALMRTGSRLQRLAGRILRPSA
jgi:uncharacterized cupin superfamily protein